MCVYFCDCLILLFVPFPPYYRCDAKVVKKKKNSSERYKKKCKGQMKSSKRSKPCIHFQ